MTLYQHSASNNMHYTPSSKRCGCLVYLDRHHKETNTELNSGMHLAFEKRIDTTPAKDLLVNLEAMESSPSTSLIQPLCATEFIFS